MNKVYITNRSSHDHSDASRFGEVVYLTDGMVDRFDTNQMYREMYPVIYDSNPDDYILITSLTSLCSMACAMFACMHERVNLLLWKDGHYIERKHSFADLLTYNEEVEDNRS